MVGDRVRDVATGEVFTIYRITPGVNTEGPYIDKNFYYIEPAPLGTQWYLRGSDFESRYVYEPS
jgi:hypothetical protein